MGVYEPEKIKKHICAGLLAHVDAGKTTLSEALLYLAGSIRKLGRVDHRDAFLDTYALERARGITFFSKQAIMRWENMEMTLLDTPGHVDFSAEMERTLRVLDYAVLIISGADGVQGHTETLWKLLEQYHIPVFLFVNKMDQPGTDREERLTELRSCFGDGCFPFDRDTGSEEFYEEISVTDEAALEYYLENGMLPDREICRLIRERKVFPCYFGSALKLEGVEELLKGLGRWTKEPVYPAEFGAKVFKIARDAQGARLTYMKITGGSLRVKTLLNGEKADQLRLYSGAKFEMTEEVFPGMVAAVVGLSETYPGQGLGMEADAPSPVLEPVLNYRICLPEGTDVHQMFLKLRQLEEEEPLLHLVWEERLGEIHAQVMGEIQIEILKSLIEERYGTKVSFDSGNIVYKETIRGPVEGVGHYEPLRHYAEVHLLMEPLPAGSGLVFASEVSEDVLDLNWQRLILTHMAEKAHRGVLTGSEITDIRMTLVAGRAHLKHTEGGDFRQATYRAIRQGLRKAESILLEPVYAFRLRIPSELTGRALSDIQKMSGHFENPMIDEDMTVIEGSAPVACMRSYAAELAAYSRGRGRLFCSLKGYEPCHNETEVLAERGYDPDQDVDNPSGSVFCEHGAGLFVPWNEVEEHMHLPLSWRPQREEAEEDLQVIQRGCAASEEPEYTHGPLDQELEAIFTRTYGPIKHRVGDALKPRNAASVQASPERERREQNGKGRKTEREREYLLVDGYNIIFSWEELKDLAKDNLAGARGMLMDILSNYQGYKKNTLILVFDAYKVEGGQGQVFKYHNIHVVFTKEAETADQYIEKTVHEIGRNHSVTVATSDALEQVIILGQGARRMSARMLKEEVEEAAKELRSSHLNRGKSGGSYFFDGLSEEDARAVEDARLGRRELFSDEIVEKGEKE